MQKPILRILTVAVCTVVLHGCFDSSSQNNNENADKSKASVQMQQSDTDKK
jgi:outer membrane biogenesis lipoprotein LolB